MASGYRLNDLAGRVGAEVRGDGGVLIRGVATLEQAREDELSFLTNPRYRDAARRTRAAAILVGPGSGLSGKVLLEAREPYLVLAQLLELFHPCLPRPAGISARAHVDRSARLDATVRVEPFAVIEQDVELGPRAVIGAGSVVGAGSIVGNDSELKPRVVLYPGTRIGARCLIHSGAVLGGDGFGFAAAEGQQRKIPQLGRVVIEDDVEIGANSAIDRGALGDTLIEQGSKIDDLVMIAHGVRVGPGSLLAAQSGVAGSTRLGSRTIFAGQSGAAGHLRLGDGVVVAAKSAVFEDQADGSFVAGIPAVDHRQWKRAQALARRLPELRKELLDLRSRVEWLEQQLGQARNRED